MPKNDTDPDDPMELRGLSLCCEEDTTETMAECLIEEFMRLGYNPRQILLLFQNPHYTGPNRVLQTRGEPFVRDKIIEVFSWWKRPVAFAAPQQIQDPPPTPAHPAHPANQTERLEA